MSCSLRAECCSVVSCVHYTRPGKGEAARVRLAALGSQLRIESGFAQLSGELTNFLFITTAIVVQCLASGTQFLVLGFKLLLALDQLAGLLFDARLPRDTPAANILPLGGDELMLHLQTLGELQQFLFLLRQRLLFLLELLAELQPQRRDRTRDFGTAQAAGDLGPELFGDEPHFERLPVDMADLGPHLFHGDALAFDDGFATFDFTFTMDNLEIGGAQCFIERLTFALHLGCSLHALPFEVDSLLIEPLLQLVQFLLGDFQFATAVGRFKFELLPLLFDLAVPQVGGSFAFLAGGVFFVRLLQLPERLRVRQRGILPIEFLPSLAELHVESVQRVFARGDLIGPLVVGLHLLLAASDFSRAMLQIFDLTAKFGFALLEVVFPFALPETGGAEIGFELSDASVELRFAAIDFGEPRF